MNTDKTKQTVLITGASKGLGYEFAKLFALNGYDLVLISRSGIKLENIARDFEEKYGVKVKTIAKDLSASYAAEVVFAELQSESINIDILVNNAGYAICRPFVEGTPSEDWELIKLNLVSLTLLTKLLLKHMIKEKRGKILNIASTAAYFPGPLMAVYCASKAFVLSFTQALAVELEGTGVTATVLCPSPTRTGFQERAGIDEIRLIKSRKLLEPATVARLGYEGMMKGKTVIIPDFKTKFQICAARLAPHHAIAKSVKALHEKP
jgi:short-subunit dehydrogenase